MDFICALFTVYLVVLAGRAVLSWFPIDPQSPLAGLSRLLSDLTEPVLAPVRGILPPVAMGGMGLDLSFFVVFLVVNVARSRLC